MKAWWRIGDKPRGRWHPLLEWGVNFSSSEKEEIKTLNIQTSLKFCFRGGVEPHPSCGKGERKRAIVFFPKERIYFPNEKVVGKEGDFLGTTGSCSDCPSRAEYGWYYFNVLEPSPGWAVRLPWRPGVQPDYADFIEPVREFLYRVMEELERRFTEARESAPSDEWMLEEEFDSFSWHTENGIEMAERKLRVIRR